MKHLDDLFNLKNKIFVITGSAGYLCSEMALAIHKIGCTVVLMDTNYQAIKEIADKFNENDRNALAIEVDVSRKDDFKRGLVKILKKYGRVDVLINGAGVNSPTPFFEIAETEWDKILGVQLKGTLFGCQVFGEQMVKQKQGSIINISSASAGPPLSKAFAYSVAKAGIKNLTQNLAREWGIFGVRVNALRPGFFPTDWSKKHFITPERHDAIINHTPMARYGKPDELIGAILWLGSDASSFVTGAEIPVDGGFSAMSI